MTTLRMQVVNSGTVQDPDVDDVLALTSTSDGQGALGLAASAVGASAIAPGAVTTAKIAAGAVTDAELAEGAAAGSKVAPLANDDTAPQMDVLFATALADAPGNEDIAVSLPAGQTYAIVQAWVEQADVGDVGNTYAVQKGASAIGATAGGSVTDGAILPLLAIAAANKAANSFANGDTLRWAVGKAGGNAGGVAYTRMRRLT